MMIEALSVETGPVPLSGHGRSGVEKSHSGRKGPPSLPAGKGILIVEDDPDAQWKLARSLTVRGHRTVGAGTGEGALALIAEWPVGVVLLDDDLPGMGGLEVVQALRKHHPRIPVIFMTHTCSKERLQTILRAGVDACILKPIDTAELNMVLRRVSSYRGLHIS